jgi:hypothetical protein
MCRLRPKNGIHDFCGGGCRDIAMTFAPLLVDVPKDHVTFRLGGSLYFSGQVLFCERSGCAVARKFKEAWNHPKKFPCPEVKGVYRTVEGKASLTRYAGYKCVPWNFANAIPGLLCMIRELHGNECFRYHGTKRECRLGEGGYQYPCRSNTCPACCILRTAFKVSVANDAGA